MHPAVKRLGLTGLLLGVFLSAAALLYPPPTPLAPTVSHTSLLNPLVRVRLMALSGRETLPLSISGHWLLRDGEGSDHSVLLTRSGKFEGILAADATGPQLGSYRSNREHIVIEPSGHEALRIGTFLYPGKLHVRMKRSASGIAEGLLLELELPLEDYVLGVVCGEMPSQAEGAQEALRAQAIAARTYALNKRSRQSSLRDDTFDQVFRGIDFHTHQAKDAVKATRGFVLRWNNALIPAFFHRNCGGATANAKEAGFLRTSIPPLEGTLEVVCRTARGTWERTVSAQSLDALATRYGLGTWLAGISTIRRDNAGRLLEVRLLGNEKHQDIHAEQLRASLHLPSTQLIEVLVQEDGSALFRGRGYGHGIGMCQEGALRMARTGANYQEILSHYYPGAELVALTNDLKNLLPALP